MRRRAFIAACAVAVAAARAHAQAPTKPARVGVVSNSTGTGGPVVGFRRGLAEKGYVEGQNLIIEERFAEGAADRLPALVADILAQHVDVLYAAGTQTALIAKRLTTTVPIVFQSGDPVGAGLVASLARPNGNLTGLSVLSGEYSRKWLALLKEAVPSLRRVGVLWNPDNPVIVAEVEQVRQVAAGLGLEIAAFHVLADDIDASLAAISSAGVDGLVITDDASINRLTPRLSVFAAEHRLPAIAGDAEWVRTGLLMSYSADFTALGRRAATYADRILKGARPADLPVEQASEFTLRLNLKTAKALRLDISPNLLAQADEVIE
ncbi:MAG TPA: ABC transporter substrate-binding protein [Stellaceae bacterium]|nr:ABC transporter substrate-binding protein [Stellaceae bacterium]